MVEFSFCEVFCDCFHSQNHNENFFDCCCCSNGNLYPRLDREVAIACFVINCFPLTSGIGTLISACCCKQNCEFIFKTIACALLQVLMTPFLIGWIWSILHGRQLYKVSNTAKIGQSEQEMSQDAAIARVLAEQSQELRLKSQSQAQCTNNSNNNTSLTFNTMTGVDSTSFQFQNNEATGFDDEEGSSQAHK